MMVEVLYLLIFAGVLFFTGVTLFGVLLSIGLSFLLFWRLECSLCLLRCCLGCS